MQVTSQVFFVNKNNLNFSDKFPNQSSRPSNPFPLGPLLRYFNIENISRTIKNLIIRTLGYAAKPKSTQKNINMINHDSNINITTSKLNQTPYS